MSLYPLLGQDTAEQVQDAADATIQGSRLNQVIVVSFAILGAFYLPSAFRALRSRHGVRPLIYLLSAYILWSSATIVWSDDAEIGVRRLGAFILLLVGTIGLGAGFYSRVNEPVITVARHVLYASCISTLILIISRLANESLGELLNPEWTLKENTAAQYYFFPVAFALMSALVIYRACRIKQWVIALLLSMVLLLLKDRGMIAGTLAASLLIWSRTVARTAWRTLGLVGGLILSGVQVDLALGGRIFVGVLVPIVDSLSSVVPYLTLGHGADDLYSLDGRMALWQVLWTYAANHPVTGYGFGAFWNAARLDNIYDEVGWRAVVAHNGFLDELLATGLVGLIICLAFWFCALRLGLLVGRRDKRSGYLVIGWVLLFLFFNSTGSLLQSYFQAPTLFALTLLFAMVPQLPETRLLRSRVPQFVEQECAA